MEMLLTVFWQIVQMLLLAGIGFLMFRAGKITAEGSKTIGNILIYLSLPCVILNSFLVERTPERLAGLWISALLAAAVLAIAVLLSRLVLGRHAIDSFAGAFSNPGFFGVPLIVASIGGENTFYIAPFIAFLNILQWTYGVSLLQRSDANGLLPARQSGARARVSRDSLLRFGKRVITAPALLAILVGLLFFLTGWRLPSLLQQCVSAIGGLNTPLAMFTIGIYMAKSDVGRMFRKPRLYLVSLVRLVLVPLAALLLLWPLPASMNDLKLAVLIAAACPVGSNIAVFAQLYDRDYTYAVETVVLSTLLSLFTLPLLTALAGVLFG